MKGFWILFLILICLAPGIDAFAVPFTIGTFDLDRGGIGSLLSDDRAEVRDAIISGFHDVVINGAPVLTEAWANSHEILWLDAVKAGMVAIVSLSSDEQQVLHQFVLNGGGVIIFTDTSAFEAANLSLLEPFGLVSQGTLNGNHHVTIPNPPASTVTGGPFGLITGYGTSYPGWYFDLGDQAVSLGTLDTNGQTHLAFIDRYTMGASAGGAVFLADHRTDSIPLILNAVAAVTASAIPSAVGDDEILQPFTPVRIFPNPFNPRTTISFLCGEPGPAQLAVYNIAGHRVALLFDGWIETGRYKEVWDGRDIYGRSVAAGQYLVRLKTRYGVDVKKVILAK